MQSIAERRKYILDNIAKRGFIKVSEMAEELNVTKATIRKDLQFLEDRNLLFRAHGSAMPAKAPVTEASIKVKTPINSDLKRKIALAAAKLITKDDSIIIASGSTMTAFAEVLKPVNHLNVVSPSINISLLLGDNPEISVLQLGGIISGHSLSVRGEYAFNGLQNTLCSKLFFGADGFEVEGGVTCATIQEATLTQHMMKAASKSILLADSTKIGRRGFGRICALEDIDILITDSGLPEKVIKSIEDLGVEVIIA